MAYSKKNYTGDGVTKLFTVTFPYIDPSHVTVLVNGLAVPYSFQSKQVIEIATAPGSGSLIQLSRNSNPESRLVDFQDDSMGTEALFNLNADQLLYLAQEAMDKTLEGTIIEEVQAIADAALASAVLATNKAAQAANAVAAITLPLPITSGGTGSTSVAQARTALGLGAAATKGVGTSAGNLPEVQAGGKLATAVVPPLTGQVLQDFSVVLNTLVTGTALIPSDDTIPQATEGFQIMTGTVTPTAIGNKIVVEVLTNTSNSAANNMVSALFRNAETDAVAVGFSSNPGAYNIPLLYRFEMVATSTAPLTFTVRCGGSAAGTTTINGSAAARRYGGTASSYMRFIEVKQ